MASLAEIRAKLQAAESKGGGSGPGDNAIYPHWNINEGDTVTVRFLPDSDPKNSFFWVERNMIRLPFSGIKNQPDSKNIQVQIPCIEMWGESCPILAEVRTWFKDKSLEEMGRKYWKKRSYIFQGFVRQNPLADDSNPENPIRRFIIGPQLFGTIKSALMDPELEELPTDTMKGLDFKIAKTSKAGYADYTTSSWARKESALTAEEQGAVDKYGLYNLSEFLPKKPSEQELKVMKEMFEASVDGRPYDADRWAAYYKPAGMDSPKIPSQTSNNTSEVSASVDATTTPPVAEVKVEAPSPTPTPAPQPVAEVQGASKGSKAEDILAMIRSRQNKQ